LRNISLLQTVTLIAFHSPASTGTTLQSQSSYTGETRQTNKCFGFLRHTCTEKHITPTSSLIILPHEPHSNFAPSNASTSQRLLLLCLLPTLGLMACSKHKASPAVTNPAVNFSEVVRAEQARYKALPPLRESAQVSACRLQMRMRSWLIQVRSRRVREALSRMQPHLHVRRRDQWR